MVVLQSDALRDSLMHWFNGHSEFFRGAMCYIRPGVGTVLYSNSDIRKSAVLKFSLVFSNHKLFLVLQVRKKACRRSRRVSSHCCKNVFNIFYI